jgi:hypothetical protein
MTGKAAPVLYTTTKRTYRNSTLDRTYGGLVKASTTDAEDQQLRVEYAALERCYRVYVSSGMIGCIGSVNPDRVVDNSSRFNRSHMAKTERQIADRAAYRRANLALTDKQRIVVDLVVCKGQSLELAGYAIEKKSKRRAIIAARLNLRDAGYRLAELWGMVR